jgi:hypothetical protein
MNLLLSLTRSCASSAALRTLRFVRATPARSFAITPKRSDAEATPPPSLKRASFSRPRMPSVVVTRRRYASRHHRLPLIFRRFKLEHSFFALPPSPDSSSSSSSSSSVVASSNAPSHEAELRSMSVTELKHLAAARYAVPIFEHRFHGVLCVCYET